MQYPSARSRLDGGPFHLLVFLLLLFAPGTKAQGLHTLANPDWNITLTDYGYSDFLLDNTPGFEGREYLSGEWAAAVAYQVTGHAAVAPQWLEPHFIFPDWPTYSTFSVITPIAQTGLNADGLPIAESVIANGDLEITLRHEMIDTVVGTAMGIAPASAGGAGAELLSDRYVLKQTCTIKNISGSALTGLQFFQFLHGLNAQRGLYDDRAYAGPLGDFRYDVTEAGIDAWAVAAGSSSAGLEDFICFHGNMAPSAYEIGHYGIEGNGVDDHLLGKPSDGVHLSVENNWQNPPYQARQGTDEFRPAQRWVAGAQRWELGGLAAGQSASVDVILSLRTGSRVPTGTGSSGGCNGGSGVPGGIDYSFDDVTSEGSCFGEYAKADAAELEVRIAQGQCGPLTFLIPGEPVQLWEVEFSGTYSGNAHLTFAYDPTLLPPGFDESLLCIYHFNGSGWEKLAGTVDLVHHTIAVTTSSLSTFALGVDGGTTFNIDVSADPPNSGDVTGGGPQAEGASVTLVAVARAGYVFTDWSENGSVVSMSPSYSFSAQADRILVARFAAVGGAKAVTTSALPSNGGSTTGDGAYAPGSLATVVATAGAGYKFSKWQVNGVVVSTSRTNTFVVANDVTMVAKFKPVYSMAVSADPPAGGEVEADTVYEAGELAKLKAKPAAGYSFVHWTQNGLPVSTATNYQFNVTASRVLVGHFALGHRMDVRAEPVNGGSVAGGGVYPQSQGVIVEAVAEPGYVFVNWTEHGLPASTSPSYSFIADSSRDLVANFVAQPGLEAVPSGGTAAICWPAGASGWVLQETSELGSGSWADCTNPVQVVGAQKRMELPPAADRGSFRLVRP